MGGTPETRYARDGDALPRVSSRRGSRARPSLRSDGPSFPIDLIWDDPTVAGYLRRLASFTPADLDRLSRVREFRCSAINDNPAIQSWTDGLVAVLDAVGSERASIFAMSGAGAARHAFGRQPSRARRLTLPLEPIRAVPYRAPIIHSASPSQFCRVSLSVSWQAVGTRCDHGPACAELGRRCGQTAVVGAQ